jgi:hypothetical protein
MFLDLIVLIGIPVIGPLLLLLHMLRTERKEYQSYFDPRKK